MSKINETKLRKVSATHIKLADKPKGFSIEGILVGVKPTAYVDKTTGEEKTRHLMVLENEQKERVAFLADAGLRGALDESMVLPGHWFKAVKNDKVPMSNGRTMNTWDIYQPDNN